MIAQLIAYLSDSMTFAMWLGAAVVILALAAVAVGVLSEWRSRSRRSR